MQRGDLETGVWSRLIGNSDRLLEQALAVSVPSPAGAAASGRGCLRTGVGTRSAGWGLRPGFPWNAGSPPGCSARPAARCAAMARQRADVPGDSFSVALASKVCSAAPDPGSSAHPQMGRLRGRFGVLFCVHAGAWQVLPGRRRGGICHRIAQRAPCAALTPPGRCGRFVVAATARRQVPRLAARRVVDLGVSGCGAPHGEDDDERPGGLDRRGRALG
jgi:hypothetical protein